jgi:hypothetical protein
VGNLRLGVSDTEGRPTRRQPHWMDLGGGPSGHDVVFALRSTLPDPPFWRRIPAAGPPFAVVVGPGGAF